MHEKLTKCPNVTWHLPEKWTKFPNFIWCMPEKINKMPEFYMIFTRKIFFPIFWEGQFPSSSSVSYAYGHRVHCGTVCHLLCVVTARREQLNTFQQNCKTIFLDSMSATYTIRCCCCFLVILVPSTWTYLLIYLLILLFYESRSSDARKPLFEYLDAYYCTQGGLKSKSLHFWQITTLNTTNSKLIFEAHVTQVLSYFYYICIFAIVKYCSCNTRAVAIEQFGNRVLMRLPYGVLEYSTIPEI